jgi:hypothetical protein
VQARRWSLSSGSQPHQKGRSLRRLLNPNMKKEKRLMMTRKRIFSGTFSFARVTVALSLVLVATSGVARADCCMWDNGWSVICYDEDCNRLRVCKDGSLRSPEGICGNLWQRRQRGHGDGQEAPCPDYFPLLHVFVSIKNPMSLLFQSQLPSVWGLLPAYRRMPRHRT